MKVHTKKFSTIIILSLLAFVMTSAVCSAQGYSRSGKTEIFGMVQMVGSTEIMFDEIIPVFGTVEWGFELDSTTIFGIGMGMNATDHWNVNTDLLFGRADGNVEIAGIAIPSSLIAIDADYFLWNVNVDYNFLADPLTPLVTAGVGLAKIDIEASAPLVPGAGSISESETNFSYNIGAGGRWDITDNILIKLIYRMTWTQIKDANDKQNFNGVALSVAYMF